MKKFGKLMLFLLLMSMLISCGTFAARSNQIPATTVIDQSSISETNFGGGINDCCKYIAQTFTAGVTGTLAGVAIDVISSPTNSLRLHVAIRTVTARGMPSPMILGETTLRSGNAPLSLVITFPQVITIIAGDQYAIVVNYQGALPAGKGKSLGMWSGASGDTYPLGKNFASVSDGILWFEQAGGDYHFQTYVILMVPPDNNNEPQGPTPAPTE